MKTIPIIRELAGKTVVVKTTDGIVEFDDVAFSDGTKATISKVSYGLDGWSFELDFSPFREENYNLNKQWEIVREDFDKPRQILWNMNKYPDEFPFEIVEEE